jgi:anti-anti-sigma factor
MKYIVNTRTVDSQTVIITCQGEMDTLAVQELRQAVEPLLADSASHLVFDLAAVEYVSSSVLSFLMATQGRVKEREGKVSLVGASDLVQQVFEMASLDSLFDFRAKLEDLGITLQAPAASVKGKEKAPRKEKVVALKEAKTTTPPQEARAPEKERVVPVGEHERREAREVEKIHPVTGRRSWKDYGAWIGIAVVASVSVLVSLYFYLTR